MQMWQKKTGRKNSRYVFSPMVYEYKDQWKIWSLDNLQNQR